VIVVRDGKHLKGRVLGFVLGTMGRRVLERAFESSVKAIEVRNSAAMTVTVEAEAMLVDYRPLPPVYDRPPPVYYGPPPPVYYGADYRSGYRYRD
jgi:hypothetical protein